MDRLQRRDCPSSASATPPTTGRCAGSTSTTRGLIRRTACGTSPISATARWPWSAAPPNWSPRATARHAGRGRASPRPWPSAVSTASRSRAGTTPASGQECVEELLRAHPDLTAVTTINEAALPGIQRALADAGLRGAPRLLDHRGRGPGVGRGLPPPLTAADVPTFDMGGKAVALLIERIAAPQTPPRHILLAPPISLRSSTGAGAPPHRRGLTPAGSRRAARTARVGGHEAGWRIAGVRRMTPPGAGRTIPVEPIPANRFDMRTCLDPPTPGR